MTAVDASARPTRGRRTDLLIGGFVGIAAFLAIVGPSVLNVGNMLWLTQDIDSFTHYLGWEFFRRSAWSWPPGMSPDYGLQFSSSIVFSDSLPLVAIPLKLLSPLLPAVFQFTGWWVLACFVLQAYFAARIAGLFTQDAVIKLAMATLLTFAPPMLWRLSLHFSLVAHWLILAGIFLYWSPPTARRWLAWTALLGASAMIHTYFVGMLIPIWLAALVRRQLLDRQSPWVAEVLAVSAIVLVALWLGGFFPLRSSMLSSGYGFFRLNLLAWINPDGSMKDSPSWSQVLPKLPHSNGDYEGFAYAGLGGLTAAVLAVPALVTARRSYRGKGVWPLALAGLLLTLFALSPHLTFANRVIEIPVPHIVYELGSSMRSSGRFFWTVYYLIPIASAWLLHQRLGKHVAGPLLLLLAALQVYDTSSGWLPLRDRLAVAGSTFPTSIDDPRLGDIAEHYKTVRAIPPGIAIANWPQVAYFALRHEKATDVAYLARPDDAGQKAYVAGIDAAISEHQLPRTALFFLDAKYAAKVAASLQPTDAMFRVGDFYVFAPGWKAMNISTTLAEARP